MYTQFHALNTKEITDFLQFSSALNSIDLSDKIRNYLSTSRLIAFFLTFQQLCKTKVSDFYLSWPMHCNV